MDGTKVGKRRAHGPVDVEDTNPCRRKRKRDAEADQHSDSVQIVGETHAPVDNHNPRQPAYIDDADERMDRMSCVQQWINSIPEDLPVWVQTSHTRTILVNKGDPIPDEEEAEASSCDEKSEPPPSLLHSPAANQSSSIRVARSDSSSLPCPNYANSSSYNNHNHQSAPNTNAPHLRVSGAVAAAAAVAATALSILGSNAATKPSAPVLSHPLVHPSHHSVTNNWSSGVNQANSRMQQPYPTHAPMYHHHSQQHSHSRPFHHNSAGTGGSPTPDSGNGGRPMGNGAANVMSSRTAVGRLFDDMETQMIVNRFRDYFTKGSCPTLNEVRVRIEDCILARRRTPISVRAKIKRLQTSGRWTDYTNM